MPKNLKTRIQHKHDIEANWLNATFAPLAGEIIIYDPDETHELPRVKIGDGVTPVNSLKFIDAELASAIALKASQSDFTTHNTDSTCHITTAERANWNDAKTHADSTHAPSDAEKNQNAFSNVVVGSTTIAADTATDSLTLVAGDNVTITPDATNDKITITAKDTVYTHPTTAGNKHIPSGGESGQILRWSADGTAAWGDDSDTTYSAGTGISLSGTTFSNAGVRSISTGSANGTISVNTNGTSADVAVKGLGTAAYTASTAYDAVGAANKALTDAKAYTDAELGALISFGTADPSSSINTQFYFKYATE